MPPPRAPLLVPPATILPCIPLQNARTDVQTCTHAWLLKGIMLSFGPAGLAPNPSCLPCHPPTTLPGAQRLVQLRGRALHLGPGPSSGRGVDKEVRQARAGPQVRRQAGVGGWEDGAHSWLLASKAWTGRHRKPCPWRSCAAALEVVHTSRPAPACTAAARAAMPARWAQGAGRRSGTWRGPAGSPWPSHPAHPAPACLQLGGSGGGAGGHWRAPAVLAAAADAGGGARGREEPHRAAHPPDAGREARHWRGRERGELGGSGAVARPWLYPLQGVGGGAAALRWLAVPCRAALLVLCWGRHALPPLSLSPWLTTSTLLHRACARACAAGPGAARRAQRGPGPPHRVRAVEAPHRRAQHLHHEERHL